MFVNKDNILRLNFGESPTADLSIEVDDVDICFERMKSAGFLIEYGPVDEPWVQDSKQY